MKLRDLRIGNRRAPALTAVLGGMTSITNLDIPNARLSGRSLGNVLHAASSNRLTQLNVSGNVLGLDGRAGLKSLSHAHTCMCTRVRTHISRHPRTHLCTNTHMLIHRSLLYSCASLKRFDLSSTVMTGEDCIQAMDALASEVHSMSGEIYVKRKPQLTYMDMNHNHIGENSLCTHNLYVPTHGHTR